MSSPKRARLSFAINPLCHAGVYDPAGVGGTHVIYVLHDAKNPEAYGGLPRDPHIPWTVKLWKIAAEMAGNIAIIGGVLGVLRSLPALRTETHSARRRECGKSGTRRSAAARSVPPEGGSDERDAILPTAGPSLLVPGAASPLAGGPFVHLPHADGIGVLVTLAFLDRRALRRRYGLPRAASLGGLIFRDRDCEMYEMWGKQMHETELDKEFWRAVPHYIRNETSWFLRRPLQRRAEFLFWDFLVRNSAASLRADPLVHSTGSMESSLPALFRGDRASRGGAALDRTVHHSRLHGHRDGAGSFGAVIRGDVRSAGQKDIIASGTSTCCEIPRRGNENRKVG